MNKTLTLGLSVALAALMAASTGSDALAQRGPRDGTQLNRGERRGSMETMRARIHDATGSPRMGRHGGPGGPGWDRDGRFEGPPSFDQIREHLNLTDEQAATLEPLHEQFRTAAKAYHDALRETLTEEQKQEGMRHMRKKMEAFAGPGDPVRHARMQAIRRLELTEDQQTELREVFEGMRDEVHSQMMEADGKEEFKAIFDSLHAQADEEIKGILTATQYEEYQQMVKDARERFKMGPGPGSKRGPHSKWHHKGPGGQPKAPESAGHPRAQ